MYSKYIMLIDPATILLVSLAFGSIIYGARRASIFLKYIPTELREGSPEFLKTRHVFLLPVVGSLFLVLLFFALKYLYVIIVIIMAFYAFVGVSFVFTPVFHHVLKALRIKPNRRVFKISVVSLWVFCFAGLVVLLWVLSFAWPVSNMIGVCLAITVMSSVRLPSLKVASFLMAIFFVYDIFWVFLSPIIFGESVMVAVANDLVSNGQRSLPAVLMVPRYFIEGSSVLGLGDIILPGIYLAFLHRFDLKNSSCKYSFFFIGFIGYVIGLFLTLLMVIVMEMGQPALLYLVPGTMVPTIVVAKRRSVLKMMWNGLDSDSDTSELI